MLKTTIITFFQKSTIPLKTEAKICTTVYSINFEARQRLKIGQVSAARTAQTQDRVDFDVERMYSAIICDTKYKKA